MGQAVTQGASVQCWQLMGTNSIRSCPSTFTATSYSGVPLVNTRFHQMPWGWALKFLQTTAQVRHPMQRSRSIAMAYRMIYASFPYSTGEAAPAPPWRTLLPVSVTT